MDSEIVPPIEGHSPRQHLLAQILSQGRSSSIARTQHLPQQGQAPYSSHFWSGLFV